MAKYHHTFSEGKKVKHKQKQILGAALVKTPECFPISSFEEIN